MEGNDAARTKKRRVKQRRETVAKTKQKGCGGRGEEGEAGARSYGVAVVNCPLVADDELEAVRG